jgi:prenylcysteine oxidase/farnesylcysteine lyase
MMTALSLVTPTLFYAASIVLALFVVLPTLRRMRDFYRSTALPRQPPLRRKLRVAIIGAGVGGTALAYWLRELYGEDVELTIVSDGAIGGRCQSVRVGGRDYEGGAAIISELNEYMRGFMRRLGLTELYHPRLCKPTGIFDGEQIVVCEADPETEAPLGIRRLAPLRSAWRFAHRYGLFGLARLQRLMKAPAAPQFERLYAALQHGEAYPHPRELLAALGPQCEALTRESTASWLSRPAAEGGGGLSKRVVDELVTGGMRSNYGGQGCESLHAFVGLVSIAGGIASRCFAVRGGNVQIPEGLVALAQPDRLLIGSTARAVRRQKESSGDEPGGGGWMVEM